MVYAVGSFADETVNSCMIRIVSLVVIEAKNLISHITVASRYRRREKVFSHIVAH